MNTQLKISFPAEYRLRRCIKCGATYYGFAWEFHCTRCKSDTVPQYVINDKLKQYLKRFKNE